VVLCAPIKVICAQNSNNVKYVWHSEKVETQGDIEGQTKV